MTRYYSIAFGLILTIALLTRFVFLDKFPPSLNWDEISHSYNAYSILKTGKDQWGVSYPIFNFRAYGDYPTTVNLYLTIPFIKALGLNAFAVRLPSAIFSIIFVLLNYFFAKAIFGSKLIAILCLLLAAISPWSLFPSRAVFQSNISQTLLLAGLFCFIKGLEKPKLFLLSSFTFAISAYAYHNTRIIVPLLVPSLILLNLSRIKIIFRQNQRLCLVSLMIFLAFIIPNVINLFSSDSLARNRWVGIINPNSINLINEKRRIFPGPYVINVLLNNKPVYFISTLAQNYLSLLDPRPIFFRGSQNYQFNPPNTGLIYWIFLPFLYFGIFKIVALRKISPRYLHLLFIFLILLLPAALTTGDFPSIRATTALPLYFLFISFGISQIRTRFKPIIIVIVISLSLLQFVNYLNIYRFYSHDYSYVWQYGYQQAVDYSRLHYSEYQNIIFTKKYGEPHEFVLFFWPWDPLVYQNDPRKLWDYHSDWYWVDGFDKFLFKNDWDIKTMSISPNSLLITSPDNFPKDGANKLETINFLDGSPAFDIVSYE